MTLQEILKSQGLNDEQIEKVTGEMKQNKIFLADEENLGIRYKKLKDDHDAFIKQNGEATSSALLRDYSAFEDRCKGRQKQTAKLNMPFALANLYFAYRPSVTV